MIKIAPSILSADFSRLGEQVVEAEQAGADYVHVDVMDGHFVPNITMGPMVASAVRRVTDLPLDVHLMIEQPERYLESFAEAGADVLTVHQEVCPHLHRVVEQIKSFGVEAGVALNPATSLTTLEEILEYVDVILVMTVNPGFGGQAFIDSMLPKVRRLRETLRERGLEPEIEVDGGIDVTTAGRVAAAGADVLVAGSAIFGASTGIREAIQTIRLAAEREGVASPA